MLNLLITETVLQYYSTPGGCKYGSSCKYSHKENIEVPAKLNFLGLPLRPVSVCCDDILLIVITSQYKNLQLCLSTSWIFKYLLKAAICYFIL